MIGVRALRAIMAVVADSVEHLFLLERLVGCGRDRGCINYRENIPVAVAFIFFLRSASLD